MTNKNKNAFTFVFFHVKFMFYKRFEGCGLNITILREFIDLAYTLNFSVTAERMFISQPTLSKHINSIEAELGVQLFVRSTQSVRLTEAGKLFSERIKPLIIQYDIAVNELKTSGASLSGTLRVGFLDAAVRGFLSAAVNAYTKQYPQINLSLVSGELGDLERSVKNDVLDIALTILFTISKLPPELQFRELYTDGLAAVVPAGNPLAEKPYVHFSELLDYPLAVPSARQYPDYYKLLQSMFEKEDKLPKIVSEFSHIDTASILAESGTAIVILGKHVSCYPHSAKFVDIMDEAAVIRVGALWKADNPAPGLVQFVDTLDSYLSSGLVIDK